MPDEDVKPIIHGDECWMLPQANACLMAISFNLCPEAIRAAAQPNRQAPNHRAQTMAARTQHPALIV